ncbi:MULTISPECIES: polysaccharide deacetylase family protein [unclassified Micromonospora]|uniref:polysaccharide deacetylase family protein n=1 Tax=unclassified Micromonospora TaxID=2617518 RepID=UPI00188F38B6|nr:MULTISPECIES: polysaccharide deacetylase family protein [unclassified Micromonospora]MBF5032059.1 polysaccharide deacetylase family protein [Micromonospora sp. ANENR4]MCZ7477867.1 polysaccharide deacetylase family protein [Micromonospora sp. WMMC273]WBC02581.1 polysaccharide deacetylase family protein [Micromonospora sp. WMMA1976]
MRAPTLRAAGLVTVVLAGLLGSAFVLGRSLVPDPHPSAAGVATTLTGPRYGEQPPSTDFPGGTTSPRPSPDAAPDAAPVPADGDGPYGAQVATGSSRVALTFDDGPDPRWTPQVLALLAQYGVRATFCVVGENVEAHPDLVRSIVAEGHTLCNHSWNHDVNLGKRSPATIRADLLRTNDAILAAAPDARIAYYRQPGGAWMPSVMSACADLNLTPLHWSVDPSDWKAPGATTIEAMVRSQMGPGAIVLMHDAGGDRSGTVSALQQLLPELLTRFELEPLPVGSP